MKVEQTLSIITTQFCLSDLVMGILMMALTQVLMAQYMHELNEIYTTCVCEIKIIPCDILWYCTCTNNNISICASSCIRSPTPKKAPSHQLLTEERRPQLDLENWYIDSRSLNLHLDLRLGTESRFIYGFVWIFTSCVFFFFRGVLFRGVLAWKVRI